MILFDKLQNRTEICVSIPEELKQCLLQDWELVMQQKQVEFMRIQKTDGELSCGGSL